MDNKSHQTNGSTKKRLSGLIVVVLLFGNAVSRAQPVEENKDEIKRFYDYMNRPVTSSDTAFSIPERDLHPEGLAYDPVTASFYIGSIRKRKVVQRDSEGRFTDFITEGLLSASGIAVDAANRKLWVASPAVPQMEGYTKEMEGVSYIFEQDLQDGNLLQKYVPEDMKSHYFGDLIVHTNGDVYISDSHYPAVYKISFGSNRLVLVKHFAGLRSLQGLALAPDGTTLYIVDYIEGIFKMDITSGEVVHLEPAGDLSLKGIDGLYHYRQSLIAVQNGVRPMRIVRLYLSEDGENITRFEYLEKNNAALDEPTLGTIVDDTFYYIANSPWGKYDDDGVIWPLEKLTEGLIFSIPLDD